MRHRVEPLLYRVLTIIDSTSPLLSAAETKPARFLKNAVRHVFLAPSFWEMQKSLLSKCSGILNLYIDGQLEPHNLPILGEMHLQKLSFSLVPNVSVWDHSAFYHPIFLSVTHLELFQTHNYSPERPPLNWDDWSPLASLPSLTHLCFSEALSPLLPHALAECLRLVVGVVAFWDGSHLEDGIDFAAGLTWSDPRLVVMVISSYMDDWEIGARGGDDFWLRAEAFVFRKRKGEIEGTFSAI